MIGNDWDIVLDSVWKSEGFKKFMSKVKKEYKIDLHVEQEIVK